MRILIIEDNKQLAHELEVGLKKNGFICDLAFTGEEGEELAYITEYDAILLDLNLPDKDGIEILKFLRKENINTPVLIATARDKLEECTTGLDVGADDYITKPYEIDEIRARIHAVTRRFQGRTRPEFSIGSLKYIPSLRETRIDDCIVDLRTKEIDILEYIISKYPGAVTVEQITDHVYGESYTENSSVVRVHIASLRRKLKELAKEEVILNQRGKGYYLWQK